MIGYIQRRTLGCPRPINSGAVYTVEIRTKTGFVLEVQIILLLAILGVIYHLNQAFQSWPGVYVIWIKDYHKRDTEVDQLSVAMSSAIEDDSRTMYPHLNTCVRQCRKPCLTTKA